MSIRKRKPFELGRYLRPISSDRIRKLEAIKQLLLELDNRLKMEMHVLRELLGSPVDANDGLDGFATKIPGSPISEVLSSSIARTTPTPHVQSSPDVSVRSAETPNSVRPGRVFLLPDESLAPPPTPALLTLPPLQQQLGQQSQEVVDLSTQTIPSTLGLHGSLEATAFASYAADLLALPTHNSCSGDSSQKKRFLSSKADSSSTSLFTSSTNVDLDVK